VIRHQAVTYQREGVKPAMVLEQVEVHESVGIGFEDTLARVSALCDMVRDIDCDDASESGHKRSARVWQTFSGNVPSVPVCLIRFRFLSGLWIGRTPAMPLTR
jgi:hypothetical protein